MAAHQRLKQKIQFGFNLKSQQQQQKEQFIYY